MDLVLVQLWEGSWIVRPWTSLSEVSELEEYRIWNLHLPMLSQLLYKSQPDVYGGKEYVLRVSACYALAHNLMHI